MVWIEKICVDCSLNKTDFSSEKWTCPNCCKLWIIMCCWIYLTIVVVKVNKKSTHYLLICHEHFESIWHVGVKSFTDFNHNLFSKIFFVEVYTFQKLKIWIYQFFGLFMRKLFFRWVIIFCKIILWSWKCYEKIRLYL